MQRLDKAKEAIDEADYVIIGAGAGLSTPHHSTGLRHPRSSGPIGQGIFLQTGTMSEKPMCIQNC